MKLIHETSERYRRYLQSGIEDHLYCIRVLEEQANKNPDLIQEIAPLVRIEKQLLDDKQRRLAEELRNALSG